MNQDLGTRGKKHNRAVIRLVTAVHTFIYRWTGGFVGGLIAGAPQLLLTTIGRKSGQRRTVPLLCLPDGPNLIVVASYGGCAEAPQWCQNLRANPQGWVQLGPHQWEIRAEQASEELKEKMWPVFCRYYPGYNAYQARTDRVIPLLVLKPVL
jgi:deazaflavin-dependent oxidoreductase (nitroreductase family)